MLRSTRGTQHVAAAPIVDIMCTHEPNGANKKKIYVVKHTHDLRTLGTLTTRRTPCVQLVTALYTVRSTIYAGHTCVPATSECLRSILTRLKC